MSSVSFDELNEVISAGKKKPAAKSKPVVEAFEDAPCRSDFKMKVALFLLYIIVCSTMFINNIVVHTGDDMTRDGNTTNKGTIVSGILLVLMYSVVEYMNSVHLL